MSQTAAEERNFQNRVHHTGQANVPHAPEITVTALSKRYPGQVAPAVDQVSFTAPAGQITVLLGPSGCGKTTLLKMINRLIEPDSGQIHIGQTEVHALPATRLRRRMGYVIQQVGLFPHMTVEQNISVVPHLERWSSKAIHERVLRLLEMVNLPTDYLQRYPRRLSGGEQQRVGLARALAANPDILLMDEPFGAIDAITRKNLQEELLQIQRQVGKTILFVTHDVEEALKLGDQLLILQAGKLVQVGAPLAVISHPQNDFVAELLGSGNMLRRLSLITAGDVLARRAERKPPDSGGSQVSTAAPVRLRDDLRIVLTTMLKNGLEKAVVTDDSGQPQGMLRFSDLRAALD